MYYSYVIDIIYASLYLIKCIIYFNKIIVHHKLNKIITLTLENNDGVIKLEADSVSFLDQF